MESSRAQRAINRLQGGRAAEEIEQTKHRRRVTGPVEGRSWLSANELYVRIACMVTPVSEATRKRVKAAALARQSVYDLLGIETPNIGLPTDTPIDK